MSMLYITLITNKATVPDGGCPLAGLPWIPWCSAPMLPVSPSFYAPTPNLIHI